MKRFGSKQKRIKEIIFHPLDSSEPIRYILSKEGKLEDKMKRAIRINYRKIEKQKAQLKLKNESLSKKINNGDDDSEPSSPNILDQSKEIKIYKNILSIGGHFDINIDDNLFNYSNFNTENTILNDELSSSNITLEIQITNATASI